MSDKIYFTLTVCRPEINSQDEEGGINITVARGGGGRNLSALANSQIWVGLCSCYFTHLISISFKVEESFTTSRTHGGGVMGRLSCKGSVSCQQLRLFFVFVFFSFFLHRRRASIFPN